MTSRAMMFLGDPTRLSGWRLYVVRGLWLAIVSLAVVTFVAAVPARYDELMRLSAFVDRPAQQLSFDEWHLLQQSGVWLTVYAIAMLAIEVIVAIVFAVLGVLIFARESSNWVAVIISLGLVTYAAYVTSPVDALMRLNTFWRIPALVVQTIGLQLALTFFYIFPNGRFVPRWTLPLAVVWAAMVWSAFFFPSVPWNFIDPWTLPPPAFVVLMVWWLTGLVAQFLRLYAEKDAVRIQQTKWVVFSATLAVFGYAVAFLPRLLIPNLRESGVPGLIYSLVALPLFYVSVLTFPFAMTFSILRYRLWDIDRLIGRTVIYAMVTVSLVLIYIGVILLLQQATRALFGRESIWPIVLSTIAVAFLAAPLRNRIQDSVDRRFFRAKYDADRTVEEFTRAARDTVDLDELTDKLTDAVQMTLQPAHVSLWIRSRDNRDQGDQRASNAVQPARSSQT